MNIKPILLFAFIQMFAFNQIQAQLFTEVSDSVGLNYNYPGISNLQIGGGVCVFDYNNDGWDDIFQAGGLFKSKLWKNNKGVFVDVSAQNQFDVLDGMYINGAVAGDINNDGWEDLFIYNYGEGLGNGDHQSPKLLINHKGKLAFANHSKFNDKGFFTSAAMADYNNDGFLDIYITNYVSNMALLEGDNNAPIGYNPKGLANVLYLNNKDETFTNVASVMNVADKGCGLACCFTDYDNDFDMDIMVANDFGEWTKNGNVLYNNQSPFYIYKEQSNQANFSKNMYGMSIGIGDYDNDLDLDYFISNIGKNLFLRNELNGSFTDISNITDISDNKNKDTLPGTSWSSLFFDMDNDMDLDLYIAKGNVENYIPKALILDPNQLFENNRGIDFSEVSIKSGIDCPLSHRGAALIDYDHDGDLDIVSSPVKINYGAFAGLSQKIKLYRNNSDTKNNWIKFILVDDSEMKSSPIGKHIYITGKDMKQMREIDGGSAHASQSSKYAHFGLGKNNLVEEVKVSLSKEQELLFHNLEANHIYILFYSGKIKKI